METIPARGIAVSLPRSEPGTDDACCRAESLPTTSDTVEVVALTDRLKALADETRLRMLDLLLRHAQALCVCEITEQFDLSQPTISHHLRLLREAGLIRGEKHGTWMYYSATNEGERCMSVVKSLV
jgi:ArsR family transcriptional regulator, arsenate/arsenite/antimonite-responsive transcriptional repressor